MYLKATLKIVNIIWVSFDFSCQIRDGLCNLFCQEDETLDLCNVKNIGKFEYFLFDLFRMIQLV
jgi:hypothetical protein